jgi:hypothetical protein
VTASLSDPALMFLPGPGCRGFHGMVFLRNPLSINPWLEDVVLSVDTAAKNGYKWEDS